MTQDISRRDVLRYGALTLGLAAAGSLAACAPSGTATAPSPGAGAGTKAEATDFRFASWSLSEDAAKGAVQNAVDAFAGPKKVTVTPTTFPYNDYLNQLTLQIRGGQFSGAAQVDVAWLSSLAALGKLTDLSALAEGRDYTETGLGAGTSGGTQYGLPWTIAAVGLIGNQELFDKAKASSSPETLDEFEDTLRALKGQGVIPYAASTKAAQLKDFIVWMNAFGSPVLEKGKVTVGDEASVDAMVWYKKLFDDGLIAPDVDRFGARTLFAQGAAALYDDALVGRSAVISQSSDSGLAEKLTPITRPIVHKGDSPKAVLWGHAVVVVDGEGSATAGEFAQWLTSDPTQTIDYFTALSLPPATNEALASDAVRNDAFVSAFTERITVDAQPSPLWQYPQYAQMETALAEQVQAVLIGSTKPKAAMKAAGEAIQSLIG